MDDLTAAMLLMMPSPTADRKRMAEKNRRAAVVTRKRMKGGTGESVRRVASAAGRAVGAVRRVLGGKSEGWVSGLGRDGGWE